LPVLISWLSAASCAAVDVQLSATAEGFTRLDVTHRGPELIGELWARTNTRFAAAWEHVLASYTTPSAFAQFAASLKDRAERVAASA
jgi:hypothetical protein